MNLEEYYASPIYPSRKSSFTVRFRDQIEKDLLDYFEHSDGIAEFFQPLMQVAVKIENIDIFVEIDFWVEYTDRRPQTDLVHLERPDSLDACRLPSFVNSMPIDELFGLIVIREGSYKRVDAAGMRFELPESWSTFNHL